MTELQPAAAAGHAGALLVKAELASAPNTAAAVDAQQRTPLHHAAAAGDAAMVRALLSAAPSTVAAADARGELPLHASVKGTKMHSIRDRLVAANPGELPTLDRVRAATAEALEVVQLLLEAAPQAALVPDSCGRLPVHLAAFHGSLEVLQLLLSAPGAERAATTPDAQGCLPLHAAAQRSGRGRQSQQVMELLLAVSGPAAATAADTQGLTPLDYAVGANNGRAVKVLLTAAPAAAAVRGADLWGYLPAHAAVNGCKSRALCQLARAAPETFSEFDASGCTALHRAIRYGTADMVTTICQAAPAAAVVPEAADGRLPLQQAMDEGHNLMVPPLVRAAPATARTVRAPENHTVLHWAVKRSHVSLTKMVLKLAPSTATLPNSQGYHPIHTACQGYDRAASAQLVKALLAVAPGAAAAVTPEERLPLHLAARRGNVGAAQLLLAVEPDALEAQDQQGTTPLHLAAELGNCLQTLQLLLGVNPGLATALDSGDHSALACAARSGFPGGVEALVQAAPGMALVKNKEGLLPLELALVRETSGWGSGRSFHRPGCPSRSAGDRIQVGRALLRVYTPAEALPILARVEQELASPLFLEAVCLWRLAPVHWALVPGWCSGLEGALPAVLGRQDAEGAAEVVRRLEGWQRKQLRQAALCLARAQQQAGVVLPVGVVWKMLAGAWG